MRVENLTRYEFKYAVRPDQLDEIRSVLLRRCVADGFSPAPKNGWYSVDTLYFDSSDWRIFQAAERGALIRNKLRVRIYPDSPGSVVKLEVKQRIADKTLKTSTLAAAENWSDWLQAGRDYSALSSETRQSLDTFLTLQRSAGAFPRVLIRYQRQAFRSIVDDYVRVTFDREMCFQRQERYSLDGDPCRWRAVDDEISLGRLSHLLMEVKFRERPPVWIADMILRMGLIRQGFSKYGAAVRRIQADAKPLWDSVPSLLPAPWAVAR